MIKILSVFGTRPEAIKMAPVVKELEKRLDRIVSRVCVTAQHRQMLDQVLTLFGIEPDYDLNVMQDSQSPTQVAAAVLAKLEPVLQTERPDWVLVQGDTTTVVAAALAAFYGGVKVGHVEAGLRTFDKRQPFPEEINRRVAGVVADLHFAPTQRARENLLREGVPDAAIRVTGNPVIDALHRVTGNTRRAVNLNRDSPPSVCQSGLCIDFWAGDGYSCGAPERGRCVTANHSKLGCGGTLQRQRPGEPFDPSTSLRAGFRSGQAPSAGPAWAARSRLAEGAEGSACL